MTLHLMKKSLVFRCLGLILATNKDQNNMYRSIFLTIYLFNWISMYHAYNVEFKSTRLFPVWYENSMKFLSGGPWNVQSHYHPLSSPDHFTWQKSENFVCSPKPLLLFLDFPTLSFPIPYPLVSSIWEESCDPWNTKVISGWAHGFVIRP